MRSEPLQPISLSRSALSRGNPGRQKLEDLLAERRYEEAHDLVSTLRAVSPADEEVLERCLALLEERLLRRYLRAIAPTSAARVVAPPDHPAWRLVTPEDRRVLEHVDGRTTFEAVAAACTAGRFATYRAMMRMIHNGVVGAAAPPADVVDMTALLPVRRSSPPLAAVPTRRGGAWRIVAVVALVGAAAAAGNWVVMRADVDDPEKAHEPVAALPPMIVAAPPVEEVAPAPPAPVPAAVPEPVPSPRAPAAAQGPIIEVVAAVRAAMGERRSPRPKVTPARGKSGSRIGVNGVSAFGALAHTAVERAVERNRGALEACHARAGRRAAQVRAILVFDRAGRVAQAAVGRGVSPPLRRCLRDALLRVRVPGEVAGARADFTLDLAPR